MNQQATVDCYSDQCATAPHLVRTIWDLVVREEMVEGPPVVCANHDEAIVMLVKLARYSYHLEDTNRRSAKRMNRYYGNCHEATATPQLGVPDDRFRLACMKAGFVTFEVSRRGHWSSVVIPEHVDRRARRELGIPERPP